MSTPLPQLFERLYAGDSSALNELTPALYGELHRIAARHLARERSDHTLQATALVHEAYVKLFDGVQHRFSDEVHFLAVASRVMRHVLVDHARARAAQKRSSDGAAGGPWATNLHVNGEKGADLLELIELDNALQALAEEDESLARLIELRYFGGLTAEESALVLSLSVHAVRHDLRLAQAWLRRKLGK